MIARSRYRPTQGCGSCRPRRKYSPHTDEIRQLPRGQDRCALRKGGVVPPNPPAVDYMPPVSGSTRTNSANASAPHSTNQARSPHTPSQAGSETRVAMPAASGKCAADRDATRGDRLKSGCPDDCRHGAWILSEQQHCYLWLSPLSRVGGFCYCFAFVVIVIIPRLQWRQNIRLASARRRGTKIALQNALTSSTRARPDRPIPDEVVPRGGGFLRSKRPRSVPPT